MDHRPLGRTGVSVSKLCLGTMMFGAWGNPDHEESIRIIHAALDAGINFIDTADVYARGESEEIVGKALAGGRRDDVVLATKFHGAMGDGPEPAGQLAPLDHPRGRELAAAARHRLDRPLPGPPPADRHRHRGDARRPQRPRAPGQGPLHRPLDLPRQPDRRGPVGRARAQPAALRHRAAGLLDPRPRDRGRRPAHLRPARHGRHLLQPADRRLALGSLAQGRRAAAVLARRAGCPSASTSPSPPTSASSTLSSSSPSSPTRPGSRSSSSRIAFVLDAPRDHRGDPRPAHHGAAREPALRRRVVLDDAVLDRIDQIVAPGTTINPVDNSFQNPALEPSARRR